MINTDTHTGPSFSLKNRLGRILWNITCVLFFRYSPKVFFGWRSLILRLFGGRIGKGVHIYPGVAIWAPWNLEVGDQCGIANGVILYSQGRISVGKKTVISQGAHICAGTHDYTHKGFKLITMPISIGDDVWIAADAFIHPGVIIGDGCVIGARAVVNKNMPAWMVCSGHPCKPIKKRIIDGNEK